MNGSATSYQDTFAEAYKYTLDILGIEPNNKIWDQFGPYSCVLNVDEVDNMENTWEQIA